MDDDKRVQGFLAPRLCLISRYRKLGKSTWTIRAFGRSRPAADASREVVGRWLLYGL